MQLVRRDEQHEPLDSSDEVLARLVLLGGLLVAQLNFHSSHVAVIRGQQLAHPAQPVGGGDLGLILDEADIIDLQVLMAFSGHWIDLDISKIEDDISKPHLLGPLSRFSRGCGWSCG